MLIVNVCLLPCPVLLLLLDQRLVLGGLDHVGRLQHKAISHSVTDVHEVLMEENIRQNWQHKLLDHWYVTELCINIARVVRISLVLCRIFYFPGEGE